MYSQLPSAMAELVANGYDADASIVQVHLDESGDKTITVEDDGCGMSFQEVNEKFLRIGRNRRENGELKTAKGRVATGKKGLGKLAFFGIGNLITISTRRDGVCVEFALDWEALKCTPAGSDYQPHFLKTKCDPTEHGTRIILQKLKRKSPFDTAGLAQSLAKLFHFPDSVFEVRVNDSSGVEVIVTNKMKYDEVVSEFEWEVPSCIKGFGLEYPHADGVAGKIITSSKPLKAGMRGVTLFANGRLVNAPEFFGVSESSHFFSYATGWLDVDFVDNWPNDVIATNRQSLDWEQDKTASLRQFLGSLITSIHRDWRDKRHAGRRANVSQRANVDIAKWYSTLPAEIELGVSAVVSKIVDESELSGADQAEAIQALHMLVPEYPRYHWRHLHPEIQNAARADYEGKDYYRAFTEAVKRYISQTRRKSRSANSTDHGMMGEVYGDNKTLSVTKGFQRPDGSSFSVDTLKSIEEGQKFLSMGIVSGGRNPVAHEEIADLRDSGLFTEKDCLDGLSLLSHLMTRLENV